MASDTVSDATTNQYLPHPPSDEQKYAYFGPQRRWILWIGFIFTLGAFVSQVKFMGTVGGPAFIYAPILLFVFAVALISLYTSTRRRTTNLYDHQALVASWTKGRTEYPTIDVFLPSAGEDVEVLENTYKAVAAMEWPADVQVYVLDDSDRDLVKQLAAQFGFNYLVRPDRPHMKKAGNLLNGYKNSSNDHIVVFDADFVPRSDFLFELIPYMDDPTVGIVQSPQFFESLPHMNWLTRGAGITQEFFYRWVQPSRDAAGSPICVGTCAIYRRAALDAAGGFAQIGHSEDVHTGVNLLRAGFKTRYIPVNVAKGMCPDTLDSFVNQQYRWCTGSMSLLKDRSFHKIPLPVKSRLSFFSGFGYYITTAILVFAVPLPAVIVMWLYPEFFHPRNYAFLLPIVLWTWVVIPRVLHGRWGPEMLRVQVVYAYAHAVAIFDIFRNSTADWVPTGAVKSSKGVPARVRKLMWFWVITSQVLLYSGFIHATLYNRTYISSLPVLFLLILSSIISVPLLFPISSKPRPGVARVSAHMGSPVAALAATGIAAVVVVGAESLVPTAAISMVAPSKSVSAPAVTLPSVPLAEDKLPPGSVTDQGVVLAQGAPSSANLSSGMLTSPAAARVYKDGPVPSLPASTFGITTVSCTPQVSWHSHTFFEEPYEGYTYKLGYNMKLTWCETDLGPKVLGYELNPFYKDSPTVKFVLDSPATTISGSSVHTVATGRAVTSTGQFKARATGVVDVTFQNGAPSVVSSMEYFTKP